MPDDHFFQAMDSAPAFACAPAADAARLLLRGREMALAAAFWHLSVANPQPLRAAEAAACSLLWLGPDEYLLLAPPAQAESLGDALEQAMAGYAHSLVDVSDRQLGFDLSGAEVETVLNGGCPLDLACIAFPVGMCTRTLLGKAEIVLWRQAEQRFRLEVWRSLAPYVLAFLEEQGSPSGAFPHGPLGHAEPLAPSPCTHPLKA